ncbi:MAG: hypothetical protein N4A38_00855 [Candidatus Gracilibacteria bacterium]|nr:hypothetical protein [Candidatus Gracilibacteria bacterium]
MMTYSLSKEKINSIEKIKEEVINLTNKDLSEDKIFYDNIYGERQVDLFDDDYNIGYEISIPSIIDSIYSEEELGDYIDETMKKIEMDSRIREDLGEDNYRIIWIFKNPSETLFKLLTEYDFEYAVIN